MPNIEVTLSAMNEAAGGMNSLIQEFNEQTNAIYQVAETLAEGWQGDASDDFRQSMAEFKSWMTEMGNVLATYPVALGKNAQSYEEADTTSAGFFK